MQGAMPLPIQAAVSHVLTRADIGILDLDWVNSPAFGPCVGSVVPWFTRPV